MKTHSLVILFLLFSTVLCENSFLEVKCKRFRNHKRISPHCRQYLGLEPPTPISTHLPSTTTNHTNHLTLAEVVEEVEKEMGGSPIWIIYLLMAILTGYGGSVAFLKCKLDMSLGRSLRLGLTCSCVRGAFRPDAHQLPIQLQEIAPAAPGANA